MSSATATPPSRLRVSDVRSVLASLRTKQKQTSQDRRIAGHVFVAFERLRRSDVQGLHFYVFEGAVSVYGTVLTHEQHTAVLRDLAALPGVLHVSDHLRVQDARPPRAFTIRPVALDVG